MDDYEFSVTDLADKMHMSRMTLHRKLKAITGENTSGFIRIHRLKHAAKLFDQGETYISDVSLNCGFLDLSYFSFAFREYFGCSPTEYIKKINSRDSK